MAKTPAQLNREKKLAAKQAENNEERPLENANEYERMLMQLRDDKQILKGIKATDKKVEAKKTMLPNYDGWIDGVLEGGNGTQDDVLATCMLWHLDCGNYDQALPIVEYMLVHEIKMPDAHRRDVATVLVDEVGAAALKALKANEGFNVDIINQVFDLIDSLDLHDQPKARLHKAKAYALQTDEAFAEDQANLTAVLKEFNAAYQLDTSSGVKKDIERIERLLKNLDKAE